jgi:hypothetical protein
MLPVTVSSSAYSHIMHVQGGYDLRNKVVVHMLAYKDNECEANIRQVKDLVKFLGTFFLLRFLV